MSDELADLFETTENKDHFLEIYSKVIDKAELLLGCKISGPSRRLVIEALVDGVELKRTDEILTKLLENRVDLSCIKEQLTDKAAQIIAANLKENFERGA